MTEDLPDDNIKIKIFTSLMAIFLIVICLYVYKWNPFFVSILSGAFIVLIYQIFTKSLLNMTFIGLKKELENDLIFIDRPKPICKLLIGILFTIVISILSLIILFTGYKKLKSSFETVENKYDGLKVKLPTKREIGLQLNNIFDKYAFIVFLLFICLSLIMILLTNLIINNDLTMYLKKFEDYWSTLISINVIISIFGAGFAFNAYQRAPYSKLLTSIPRTQNFLLSTILVFAILPLLIQVSGNSLSFNYGSINLNLPSFIWPIFTIPTIIFLSYLSLTAVHEQATPGKLLLAKCNEGNIIHYLQAYKKKFLLNEIIEKNYVDKAGYVPSIFSIKLKRIPTLKGLNDPFIFLESIGLEAIKLNDINTFEMVISHTLYCYLILSKVVDNNIKEYRPILKNIYKLQSMRIIKRLASNSYKCNKDAFSAKIIDIINEFLLENHQSVYKNRILGNILILNIKNIGYESIKADSYSSKYHSIWCINALSDIIINSMTEKNFPYIQECSLSIIDIGRALIKDDHMNFELTKAVEKIMHEASGITDLENKATVSFMVNKIINDLELMDNDRPTYIA